MYVCLSLCVCVQEHLTINKKNYKEKVLKVNRERNKANQRNNNPRNFSEEKVFSYQMERVQTMSRTITF